MSINILFYGNCQCNAINLVLNLPSNYNICSIECFSTNIESDEFTNIIKNLILLLHNLLMIIIETKIIYQQNILLIIKIVNVK